MAIAQCTNITGEQGDKEKVLEINNAPVCENSFSCDEVEGLCLPYNNWYATTPAGYELKMIGNTVSPSPQSGILSTFKFIK